MEQIAAWIGGIVGALGGLSAVWSTIQKNRAETQAQLIKIRNEELDYLFSQYKVTVDRVRKEHEEDRALLTVLQTDHIHCREEMAALKERLVVQDHEIKSLRVRIQGISN